MPLSTTKYCIFHQIPGSELCLNWYLMNCSPYHLHKAGISSLCIEQGMSCDLPARSESLLGLGTPGCACCRWDHLVRTGPWHLCSSAEVVLSSSFSMPGDAESLDLEVMQRADEKMVFCCNNSLQAPCTDLSDIRCCWFIPKLTSSPWCLVFIPCKLWLLKKKHWLMKLNIKMQKQSPQCPPLFAVCVLRVVFMLHTIEVIGESKMCLLFRSFWVCSAVSVSGKGCLRIQGEVRNLLQGVWGCTETAPRGLIEGERKDGGARSVWTWRNPHLPKVPECCCRSTSWALCFQTPGLHLTSELSVPPWPLCCVLAAWICSWGQVPYPR